MGEEGAAQVMKYLGPREVQKLGEAMTSMKTIPQEEVEDVLHEFNVVVDQNSSLGLDSNDYIRTVLKKTRSRRRRSARATSTRL